MNECDNNLLLIPFVTSPCDWMSVFTIATDLAKPVCSGTRGNIRKLFIIKLLRKNDYTPSRSGAIRSGRWFGWTS